MNVMEDLKQRADYTHKYNARSGRHGWLRLTPAYSVKVVEDILTSHPGVQRVLDPFCGSGTTSLCAARHGFPSVTTDINPFLIWLAKAKTRRYSNDEIQETRAGSEAALATMEHDPEPAEPPPIRNIERWWDKENLSFLCGLQGAVDKLEVSAVAKDLLRIAFCRTLMKLSNAAFNHQSMSFKENGVTLDLGVDRAGIFKNDVGRVIEGCTEEIPANATIVLQDARSLDPNRLGKFDLLVTSPPYANRMSYIRELRPYMYWLGFLRGTREAGELDWKAIGGTWGIATSRLDDWTARQHYTNEHLSAVVATIAQANNKHAGTLSRYVHKYHEDIFTHLSSVTRVLNRGANVHYIIGNSTFYGTLVRVEDLYADMMRKVGFTNIDVRAIRKRNSKKELVEFDVSATWQAAAPAS